jgi:hypothetical protein
MVVDAPWKGKCDVDFSFSRRRRRKNTESGTQDELSSIQRRGDISWE